ncbi:four-helix bundle copper-binding protein [Azotobacter salinestris]|uniref:four-helix bundle copper-binding protein n=1 Tax=Azotobacter salinestris TaxID=69964 RepID=UPI001266DCBA|nr:four-helix bundle copper-binding protein [Azotobacter salinestris]
MTIMDYTIAIQACSACAVACDTCAEACRQAADPQPLRRCIELNRDCADLCRLTALLMVRESEWAATLCRLCARLCTDCAEECIAHRLPQCQECAQTCQHCADECETAGEAA